MLKQINLERDGDKEIIFDVLTGYGEVKIKIKSENIVLEEVQHDDLLGEDKNRRSRRPQHRKSEH